MSPLDNQELYKNNTYNLTHERGDYTPFYVAITICSVIGGFLFILNIAFCWCSKHRQYWQDRHTGNRWITSMWVVTPHKNPPLDLSELKPGPFFQTHYPESNLYYPTPEPDVESHYPDSELGVTQRQEYMELHKRESDI